MSKIWKKSEVKNVDSPPSQIPAFYLTKASAKFEIATSNYLGGDAFTRKYIISPNGPVIIRRRCRLKTFLIKSSGGPLVHQRGTICAILVGRIMRNNSVKLF